MKMRLIFSVSLLLVIAIVGRDIFKQTQNFENDILRYTPRTEMYGFAGALQYYADLHRNVNTGEVNPSDYYKALAKVKKMPTTKVELGWKNIGPENIGGRTRAILIDKDNHNIVYAGAVSGGLYMTVNGGLNWVLVGGNDGFTSSAISCIAQAPNGDIYVGTGEYFAQPSSTNSNTGTYGQGMWKSTDGETFVHLTSTWDTTLYVDNTSPWRAVNALAVRSDGRVYAATMSGLKYSDDGGETWNNAISSGIIKDVKISPTDRVYAVASSSVVYSDDGENFSPVSGMPASVGRMTIAISPSDPNYVYILAANTNSSFKNVYMATDGYTFSPIFDYIPTDFDVFGPNNQGWYDNIIAVYPDNPEKIIFGGVDLWTYDPENNYQQITAWYLSEANPKYVHADQHAIVFHPNYDGVTNKTIYVGSDGGVFISRDGGENWQGLNNSYITTQFYGFGISNTDAVIGGTQDNGSIYIKREGITPATGFEITGGDGGDAEISFLRPDVLFTTMYYGQLFRSEKYGDEDPDGGMYSNFVTSFHNIGIAGGGEPFVTRIALWESFNDPYSIDSVVYKVPSEDTLYVGDTIYVMSNTKYRYIKHIITSSDAGSDGIMVEGDSLTFQDPYQSILAVGLNGDVYVTRQALDFTKVPCAWGRVINSSTYGLRTPTAMMWSKGGDALFVGDNYGNLFRVTGFHIARTQEQMNYLDNTNFALTVNKIATLNGYITSIYIDPQDSNNVIVTLGGYGLDHIYYTSNAFDSTVNFVSKQGNLPDMPVYASIIRWDDSGYVLIGTDFGTFVTEDITSGNPTWVLANTGEMGHVPIFAMKQQIIPNFWYDNIYQGGNSGIQNHGTIYAASHGKGIFKLNDFSTPLANKPVEYANNGPELNIYPNPATNFVNIEVNSNTYRNEYLKIISLDGKIIKNETLRLNKGKNTYKVDVSSLNSGVYIITIGNKMSKFIKR